MLVFARTTMTDLHEVQTRYMLTGPPDEAALCLIVLSKRAFDGVLCWCENPISKYPHSNACLRTQDYFKSFFSSAAGSSSAGDLAAGVTSIPGGVKS